MNKFECATCLFRDNCPELGIQYSRTGCDNYAPGDEQSEDELLDDYIQERREQFAAEWQSYLRED